MNTPDSNQEGPRLSEELSAKLQLKKGSIMSAARICVQDVPLDETDRSIITETVAFIENPSANIEEIKIKTANIGEVVAGFEMQGAEVPKEIDALHEYLLSLQCLNRIEFIEKALEQGTGTSPDIQLALDLGRDWASILAKGYKDSTFLDALSDVQARINPFEPKY